MIYAEPPVGNEPLPAGRQGRPTHGVYPPTGGSVPSPM